MCTKFFSLFLLLSFPPVLLKKERKEEKRLVNTECEHRQKVSRQLCGWGFQSTNVHFPRTSLALNCVTRFIKSTLLTSKFICWCLIMTFIWLLIPDSSHLHKLPSERTLCKTVLCRFLFLCNIYLEFGSGWWSNAGGHFTAGFGAPHPLLKQATFYYFLSV